MCDIISVIEELLVCESGRLNGVIKFKFIKNKKKHKDGDYICYYHYCQEDNRLLCEMQQTKRFLEISPCVREYLKIEEAPHGLNIFLDRNLCFMNCIYEISKSLERYGNNNIFEGKVFRISVDSDCDSESLTDLRLKLVENILKQLVIKSGGCINEKEKSMELICINVTTKHEKSGSTINVLVGTVKDGCSFSKYLTTRGYERSRKEEINSMCEHKLALNEVIENQDDLVRLTLLFDLLQSNIYRSVTLRLFEELVLKTSCKGSLFVMYNYVRFYKINESFNKGVEIGKYPPLPPISEIDFTLLSDDEWPLMFNFILEWPSVLRKCILDLNSGRPKIHLFFNFLTAFSLQCSQYYHRTRILVEPRNHLLPILFARIYFVRSINQIYLNCFRILNVTPLIRM